MFIILLRKDDTFHIVFRCVNVLFKTSNDHPFLSNTTYDYYIDIELNTAVTIHNR